MLVPETALERGKARPPIAPPRRALGLSPEVFLCCVERSLGGASLQFRPVSARGIALPTWRCMEWCLMGTFPFKERLWEG